MTEIKDILARALPEQPPAPSITRERAVEAGRRAYRRRQWWRATAGGTAIAVALIAGVGLMQWNPHRGAQFGAPAPAPAASTGAPVPSATPSPVMLPPRALTTEDPDRAVARLTGVLQVAARGVLPNATFRPIVNAYGPRPVEAFEFVRSQGGYKAFAEVSDKAGPGTFFLYLSGDGGNPTCPDGRSDAGETCENRTGPHGEVMIVVQGRDAAGVVNYVVDMVKPDGSSLHASMNNYSENDQPPTKNATVHPQRLTPPMTVDQLIALLATPELTVYV
jgi:hypothetical protein